MNDDLLVCLSNADAVASKEDEVRNILWNECKPFASKVDFDGLGSILFHKNSEVQDPLKVMFTGHMDEVGFLVRHISEIGMLYLIRVGGVIDKSLEMQKVRITTANGTKVYGLMNAVKDETGSVKEIYVDIGASSKEDVKAMGVEIGNMVTFDSNCHSIAQDSILAGKAMDDRTGCYVIAESLKQLHHQKCEAELIFSATSSEEVGIRGAKTAVTLVDPDIVFAIDVANHPELVRDYTNHRQIGKGVMIVCYDKTLAPNEKLLKFVKKNADKEEIPYQLDMFSGGGTDAGSAHLIGRGKLAMVIGIPLRYCHGSVSYVHKSDLDAAVKLVCALSKQLTREKFNEFTNFIGG